MFSDKIFFGSGMPVKIIWHNDKNLRYEASNVPIDWRRWLLFYWFRWRSNCSYYDGAYLDAVTAQNA